MNRRQTLYFVRPHLVEIHNDAIPRPAPHQILVKTVISAISAGTEMLFYRGQVPSDMIVDAAISGMEHGLRYPLTYGYCSAGEVIAVGNEVDPSWHGRRVFAFNPHTSHFVSEPESLLPIPDTLTYEQAVFLPNMETAVNFVMDARPIVGERVILMGLGIVGLLTLRLLRKFPLGSLAAMDVYAKRRGLAALWGADILHSPTEVGELLSFNPDLILEVSSNPAALTSAIELAGFGTRIVVGSWYGMKSATLPLGGNFHRNRVQLISSQVSTVDGQFSNRWNKVRRLQTAWSHLHDLPISDLITHRIPIEAAGQAYQLLDHQPDQVLQLLLTYE